MKLKHFAGYGCVNAKKISNKDNTLVVEVRGEHERGLVIEDKYDVFNWLVKRFDKTRKDYFEILDMEIEEDSIEKKDNYTGYEDIVTYKIHFKD